MSIVFYLCVACVFFNGFRMVLLEFAFDASVLLVFRLGFMLWFAWVLLGLCPVFAWALLKVSAWVLNGFRP